MAEAGSPKAPPARARVRPRPSAEPQESPGEPAKSRGDAGEPSGGGAARTKERQGDYEVGYGRPPLHSRVQPGQRLNPKGRPRGSKNTATLITEELDRKIAGREGNRVTKFTKRQAAIRNLTTKAAAGDSKVFLTLITLEGGSGTQPGNSYEGPPLAERDRAILDHMRQELAASLSPNTQPVKKDKAG